MDNYSFDSTKFILGKLCIYNHDYNGTGRSLRYISRGCCECTKLRSASEKAKQRRKDRYKSDEKFRLEHLKRLKDWSEGSKNLLRKKTEKFKAAAYERTKDWRKRYPERQVLLGRVYTATRRTRKKLIHQGFLDAALIDERIKMFDGQCAYCGSKAESLDHFIPVKEGGCNTINNLLPACLPCNKSKAAKPADDWYKSSAHFSKARWKKILKVLGKTENTIGQLPLF